MLYREEHLLFHFTLHLNYNKCVITFFLWEKQQNLFQYKLLKAVIYVKKLKNLDLDQNDQKFVPN